MSFYGAPPSNTPEDHGDWISKAGWVGIGLLALWAFRADANDTRRNPAMRQVGTYTVRYMKPGPGPLYKTDALPVLQGSRGPLIVWDHTYFEWETGDDVPIPYDPDEVISPSDRDFFIAGVMDPHDEDQDLPVLKGPVTVGQLVAAIADYCADRGIDTPILVLESIVRAHTSAVPIVAQVKIGDMRKFTPQT